MGPGIVPEFAFKYQVEAASTRLRVVYLPEITNTIQHWQAGLIVADQLP